MLQTRAPVRCCTFFGASRLTKSAGIGLANLQKERALDDFNPRCNPASAWACATICAVHFRLHHDKPAEDIA
jgi:hypothetical protein